MLYCVIHQDMLVGVYSSAVDAHLIAKQLLGSMIQECRLNTETLLGAQLLSSSSRGTISKHVQHR